MNINRKILACFQLGLMLAVASVVSLDAYSQIFQCKDENGRTIFRDSACSDNQTTVQNIDNLEVYNDFSGSNNKSTKLASSNLVLNADFEKGEEQWLLPPNAQWLSKEGKYASAAVSIKASKPPDNKYIYETVVEQCILLGPAKRYMWSAEVKLLGMPEKANANRANIIWYRSEDCTSGGQWGAYLEPTLKSGWQKLRGKPVLAAMGAQAVKLTLVQNGRFSRGGEAVWDNIEFYGLGDPDRIQASGTTNKDLRALENFTPGYNLLRNGAFGSDLEGWRRSSYATWVGYQGNKDSGSVRTLVSSDKQGFGVGVLNQCVELGQQRDYTLSAKVLKDLNSTQGGGGRLRISWNSKVDCRGQSQTSSKHADFENKSGWQDLQIPNLVAPNEARGANIELIQSVDDAGSFIVYWDDVELTVQ